jgi:hypothetical protein
MNIYSFILIKFHALLEWSRTIAQCVFWNLAPVERQWSAACPTASAPTGRLWAPELHCRRWRRAKTPPQRGNRPWASTQILDTTLLTEILTVIQARPIVMDDSVTLVQKELLRVSIDRLCDLVVRVPGYTTEMYCASCEVRTEFIYVM